MTAWADAFRAAVIRQRQALADLEAARALRCPWTHPDGGWPCIADAEPAHVHNYDPADLPGREYETI